jgi:hypothetical protein
MFSPTCRHFNQCKELEIAFQTYSDDLFRLRPARSQLPAFFVQLTLFCFVHFTFQKTCIMENKVTFLEPLQYSFSVCF